MLSVQLKSGEYITIGDNIVVQVFQAGSSFHVSIDAPREIPIARGELHERSGERPDCLHDRRPKGPSQRKRSYTRNQDFNRSARTGMK